jgi:hypothetical protein
MESLKSFEWYRNVGGYRLAWRPQRGKSAFWINEPSDGWSGGHEIDRSAMLEISTGQGRGEKRIAARGMYVAHTVQILNRGKPDELSSFEIVRPFESNELVSLNLLQTGGSPQGWLSFANRYGMIGRQSALDRWHLTGRGAGKDKRWFICEVEHEGEWHHLRNVLRRIYRYFPAIKKRDSKFLSKFITWDSDDVVREEQGPILGRANIRMAIAMRGKHGFKSHYFEHMKRPDLFVPAAFVLRDEINGYTEKALSLQTSFDLKTLEFSSSLRYGSLGAALVTEAVEFMAGHFEARQCAVCGSWFRVGTGQMRADRRFCSAACKMRDYRARKSKQRQKQQAS